MDFNCPSSQITTDTKSWLKKSYGDFCFYRLISVTIKTLDFVYFTLFLSCIFFLLTCGDKNDLQLLCTHVHTPCRSETLPSYKSLTCQNLMTANCHQLSNLYRTSLTFTIGDLRNHHSLRSDTFLHKIIISLFLAFKAERPVKWIKGKRK